MTEKSTSSIYFPNLASFIFGILVGIAATLLVLQSQHGKVYTQDQAISPIFDNPKSKVITLSRGSSSHSRSGSNFRCQQSSETFPTSQKVDIEAVSGVLTLKFDAEEQTVSIGSLTGLEYHQSGNTVKFRHSPNYLEQYQFIDSYHFDAVTGKLQQEVKVPITGAVSSPTDTSGYTLVYTSTYDCIKKMGGK